MAKLLGGLLSDKRTRLRLIFALGIVGMALILISDMLPQKKAQTDTEPTAERQGLDDSEQYRRALEEQLSDIVSGISGAGSTRVMITVGGSREYVYAEKSDVDRKTRSDEETLRSQGEPIMSGDTPIVRKVLSPQIVGAAVICEGAADPVTRERIMNTVSAVLGIPFSRISVEPMA